MNIDQELCRNPTDCSITLGLSHRVGGQRSILTLILIWYQLLACLFYWLGHDALFFVKVVGLFIQHFANILILKFITLIASFPRSNKNLVYITIKKLKFARECNYLSQTQLWCHLFPITIMCKSMISSQYVALFFFFKELAIPEIELCCVSARQWTRKYAMWLVDMSFISNLWWVQLKNCSSVEPCWFERFLNNTLNTVSLL